MKKVIEQIKRRLKITKPEEIGPSDVREKLVKWPVSLMPHWCTKKLASYAKKVPPGGVILEMGTFAGGTTRELALANPYAEIHTVDLNDYEAYFKNHPDGVITLKSWRNDLEWTPELVLKYQQLHWQDLKNITSHTGHSRSLNLKNISLAFVDASHEYSEVLKDLHYLWDRMKLGGIIVGDDFDFPDVANAVADFCREVDIGYTVYAKLFIIEKVNNGPFGAERIDVSTREKRPW